MQNQVKGILVSPSAYCMNNSNLFSRFQNSSILKNEPTKKSQARINY